jgi:hypothetical protein
VGFYEDDQYKGVEVAELKLNDAHEVDGFVFS